MVLLPSTLLVVAQPIQLVMQMFDLHFTEYWAMFLGCAIVEVLGVLWVAWNVVNSKGEELYQDR